MTVLCPLWIFSVTLDWVVEAYKMINHVDVTLQLEKHIQVWKLSCGLLPWLPFNLGGLGWLDQLLDNCWGQVGSILGHQVAPQ